MPSSAHTASPLAADLRRRINRSLSTYYPEIDNTADCRIEPVSHMLTADNTLLLFRIACPQGNSQKLVLCKRLLADRTASDAVKREHDMLRLLYAHPLFEENGFSVPRPLDFFTDLRVVVMEYVAGLRLTDIIRSKNRFFASSGKNRLHKLAERCGLMLKNLHTITNTRKQASLHGEMLQSLEQRSLRAFDRLAKDLFKSRQHASQQRRVLEKAFARVRELTYPLTRIHGDYYAGNILVSDSGLCLIDFAFSKPGFAHEDVARFLLFLELLNPYPGNLLYDPRQVAVMQSRFLKGYGVDQLRSPEDELLLTLYRVRGILFHCKRRTPKTGARPWKRLYFSVLLTLYRRKINNAFKALERLVGIPAL